MVRGRTLIFLLFLAVLVALLWAVWRPVPEARPAATETPSPGGGATPPKVEDPPENLQDGNAPPRAADPAASRPMAGGFLARLASAATERTRHQVTYDPAYVRIDYPGGDVPADRGVCADVIIRAYRAVGIDLQKEVHEDMKQHFARYPHLWGLRAPDSNIDHRRVPNLKTFLSRHGRALPTSDSADDYSPGDMVVWSLGGGRMHVGLVVDSRSGDGRPLVVHNIGRGPRVEDVLFAWPVIGHYRYPADPERPESR